VGATSGERHVPISEKRELEIERELDAIMCELERCPPLEKPTLAKPKQVVQLPWAPPLLLDE
jgi:hypothetical protein